MAISIIQKGEEAKFRVTIADFDMENNNFTVTLINGYRQNSVKIIKDAMLCDEQGRWYIVVDTKDMTGKVTAECTYYVPDGDTCGTRVMKDRQFLCFVTNSPRPQLLICSEEGSSNSVTYEKVTESDLDTLSLMTCWDRRAAWNRNAGWNETTTTE